MRKSKEVTITAEGRDRGKKFALTEMPARQAESWAMRALGAMARSGIVLPEGMMEGGLVAFAAAGLKAFMAAPWADVSPMLDELMGCVQRVEHVATRALVEDDVEEIATFARLRDEVLGLHLGFSLAFVLLGAGADQSQTPGSSDTPTSATPSEPSSLAA